MISKKPEVTVLMPVYNGGEYIRLSIESILSQTYKEFELLIINDCSTDNSLETIKSFNDRRIVVHSNEVNIGQTKSLNVGLRLAKGKYIAVNDADDLSLPNRIEKQLSFISSHPEFVVVGSSSFIMDRSGRLKRTFNKPVDLQEILLWILSDTPIIHGSVIMNREIILANGGYNEEFRICQDYELWSSLIRKGFQVANLPDRLVVIRHYMSSISFKEKDAQMLENGKIMCANVKALTNFTVSLEDAIRQRLFFAAPDRLSIADFEKANELFLKEYSNLNNNFNINQNLILNNLKKKLLKPYCKLAIFMIKSGRLKESRKIMRSYLKEQAVSAMPFAIWMMSFAGRILSYKTLSCFEKWQELTAKLYRSTKYINNEFY